MPTITGLIHYVEPPLGKPWKAPQYLAINADGSLSKTFRDALLKSQEAFTVDLRVSGQPELFCNFARCGEAAGVAHWWREGGTEAVTAYLPGVDPGDEDIVEQALALKPYPISLHIWHEVLKAERPIYANFLLTPAAAEDRLLATAADALAFSFFSILGATSRRGNVRWQKYRRVWFRYPRWGRNENALSLFWTSGGRSCYSESRQAERR